jgi:hypothetical protein
VLESLRFDRKTYGTQFAIPIYIKIKTIKELTMFSTLESEPKYTNCPRCESTNTFLSAFSDKSYCTSCRKLYDKIDGARIRKQLRTLLKEKDVELQEFELIFSEYQDLFYKKSSGLFNPSNAEIARGKLIQLT